MLTRQDILNTAYSGLMNQGRGAYNRDLEECRYRTADGAKCAVGMLIPDALYTEEIEGFGISRADRHGLGGDRTLWGTLKKLKFLKPEHLALLRTMQLAHDEYCSQHPDHTPEEFRQAMTDAFAEIAVQHGLNGPVWTPAEDKGNG